MTAISYASNKKDMQHSYLKSRKLKKLRNWLHYLKLIEGGLGAEASDILENQIKWKRSVYRNNQPYYM